MTDPQQLFELEIELPNAALAKSSSRLVGFEQRYQKLQKDLHILSNPDALERWSMQHYKAKLPLCEIFHERYPLIIFEGDVGTGKTAMAEASCDRLAREIEKTATLFKLSTRVRGSGMVGSMSQLINEAFRIITETAGKQKLSFLIIDEADSLTATRAQDQSHHEDKVGVNTLIQKIDDLRRYGGRIVVFISTNRIDMLDPAILRRAALIENFARPTEIEREALIRMDCEGLGLDDEAVKMLVDLTGTCNGTRPIGFSYSDLRLRWLPAALNDAFPLRKLEIDDLIKAAMTVKPTPALKAPSSVQLSNRGY